MYKLHLPESVVESAVHRVPEADAYQAGRQATYADDRAPNPYRPHTRAHEAWDNGRADELESFA